MRRLTGSAAARQMKDLPPRLTGPNARTRKTSAPDENRRIARRHAAGLIDLLEQLSDWEAHVCALLDGPIRTEGPEYLGEYDVDDVYQLTDPVKQLLAQWVQHIICTPALDMTIKLSQTR